MSKSFRSRFSCGFRGGGIVAFAIDGGHLAAHGSEIGGELPAMVNGVVQRKIENRYGGHLHQAAKVDDFGELFAREIGEACKISSEGMAIPLTNLRGSGDIFGTMNRGEVKCSVNDSGVETVLRGNNMPGQFEGGFGVRIGAIVGADGRNCFDDGASEAVFVLYGRKCVLQ